MGECSQPAPSPVSRRRRLQWLQNATARWSGLQFILPYLGKLLAGASHSERHFSRQPREFWAAVGQCGGSSKATQSSWPSPPQAALLCDFQPSSQGQDEDINEWMNEWLNEWMTMATIQGAPLSRPLATAFAVQNRLLILEMLGTGPMKSYKRE